RHQATAGFQMTLRADFKLPVAGEPRRVHDRLPYLFSRSICVESRANVGAAGSMAPLAINPFRNFFGEHREAGISALRVTPFKRQAIVAKHALPGNCPAKVFLAL